MRNNIEYKDEIFYSECCGLCKYFCNARVSNGYSLLGLCHHEKRKEIGYAVYTHNWCNSFELDKELAENLEIE